MNSEVYQFANDNILLTWLRSGYHFRDSQRNLTYTGFSLMNTKKFTTKKWKVIHIKLKEIELYSIHCFKLC